MSYMLHHAVAKEKTVKAGAEKVLTKAHHLKVEMVNGISRTFVPFLDGIDASQFPPENQKVQVRIEDMLADVSVELTKYWDITLTKETGNTHSKADVVVGGKTIALSVPIIFLIWLEKRLSELMTFFEKLPTLSEAEHWEYDKAVSLWTADAVRTVKTQKVPEVITKAPATHQHPAQTELVHIDKTIGHWTTVKRSGALPTERVRLILSRLRDLLEAVKHARQTANSTEIKDQAIGHAIWDYLLAK